jgi:hypothetical protein
MQGYDRPVNTTVAGFPLNETSLPFTGGLQELDYLSKQAWRLPATATDVTNPSSISRENSRNNNNYIWVSWDIVTDWYHKGRCWGYPDSNTLNNAGAMDREDYNAGSILCTYGAVNYRYEQLFWNSGPRGSGTR